MAMNGNFIAGFDEFVECGIFNELDAEKPFGSVFEIVSDGINFRARNGGMIAKPIYVIPAGVGTLSIQNVRDALIEELATMSSETERQLKSLGLFWSKAPITIDLITEKGSNKCSLKVDATTKSFSEIVRNYQSATKAMLEWLKFRKIEMNPATVLFFATDVKDSKLGTITNKPEDDGRSITAAIDALVDITKERSSALSKAKALKILMSQEMTSAEIAALGNSESSVNDYEKAMVGVPLFKDGNTPSSVGFWAVRFPDLYTRTVHSLTTRKVKWSITGRGLSTSIHADRWLVTMLLLAGRKLALSVYTSSAILYDSTDKDATLRSIFYNSANKLNSVGEIRDKVRKLSYSGKSRKWKPAIATYIMSVYWLLTNLGQSHYFNELDLVSQIPELANPVMGLPEMVAKIAAPGNPDESEDIQIERIMRFNTAMAELSNAMKALQTWLKEAAPQPSIITPSGSNLVDQLKHVYPARTMTIDGQKSASVDWARSLWGAKLTPYNVIEPRIIISTYMADQAIDLCAGAQLNQVKFSGELSNYIAHAVWDPICREITGSVRLIEFSQKGHYLLFFNANPTAFAAYMDAASLLSKDFAVPTPVGDGSVDVD